MKRLRRPRLSVPTLVQIKTDYPLNSEGIADNIPDGKWNNPDVRGAVYAMCAQVCAYCQRVASDGRGDIEHFRPKSDYPWLMYEFANYLLGCRVCNSARKSNRFPLAPRARPIAFDPRVLKDDGFLNRLLAREKRLLLDPAADPIEEWVDIDFNNPVCEIIATMVAKKHRSAKRQVPETLSFFGLNLLPELIDDRKTFVYAAIIALTAWRDGDTSRAADVRTLANRYKPHGWAVRRVAQTLAPDLALPTPKEELKWFVDETLDRLDLIDTLLPRQMPEKDRDLLKARGEEASWTLAALWNDPPAASSAELASWIAARGRLGAIAKLRQVL